MELRHFQYFVAVAETGSLTTAAEQRLHTSQPSLSRQIRDLEAEVGAQLLIRSARGVELTEAGLAFLEHARLVLMQAELAAKAAWKVAHPAKPVFALGFLTGEEMNWLPETMRTLCDELPNTEVTISSQNSPQLGQALMKGELDLAFMRAELNMPDLIYRHVDTEPLVAAMPRDHRFAAFDEVDPRQLVSETFIAVSRVSPTLKLVIDEFISKLNVGIRPSHEVDNLAMAMSLVASTRGIMLVPAYAENLLPASVVCRPLAGEPPTIDLVIGYSKTNTSTTLNLFLNRVDDLISRCLPRQARNGY